MLSLLPLSHKATTEQLMQSYELYLSESCTSESTEAIERLEQLASFVAWQDSRLITCLYDHYMLVGLPARALEIMEKGVQLVPGDSELAIRLAEAQSVNGNDADADRVVRRVLVGDPTNIQALEVYQNILRNMERHDEFVGYLQSTVTAFPGNSDLYAKLATVQREGMDAEGAVETLRAGLRSVPGDTNLMRALADHLSTLKQFDEAATLYQDTIAAAPEEPYGYLQLAEVYAIRGDVAGAEDLYRKGQALSSVNAE